MAFLAWPAMVVALGADPQPKPQHEIVVVTGAFEPIPLEEADRSVKVFHVGEQLPFASSAADLLRLDPSLDLRERAPGGVQADLSIRGATFGQTLVLLNGMRLNDAQSGHHNFDIPVPLEAVSRIETLRGSGSTLYGSDATGGVVNFVTSAPAGSELRLRGAAGNFGVNQQRTSLSLVRGRLAQTFAASRDFSSGFMPDRDYRNLSLSSSTWLPTGSEITLAHNDRPFGADQFYGRFPSWEYTRTWFASLRQSLGARTSASFAYRRHTDRFVLYRYRPEVYDNRHAVESFQAGLRRTSDLRPNARLFYGFDGVRESIASTNLGAHTRQRGAAYVSFDMRALRRFSFSLGGREEVYRSRRGQFSPNAAVAAWLSPRLKLRAGASHAFRVPSYTDLYYHDPTTRGAADLRPESAWNLETGLDWNGAGRLRGDVTVFRRFEKDVIDYVLRPPDSIWRAANIHRLNFTGVEASVGTQVTQVQTIDFRYTGLKGARGALEGVESRYVFNYPVHSAVLAWQGALPGELAGRTSLGLTDRVERSAYMLWNASLARVRGRIRPFLQFANVTATKYESIPGVAMPGRSVIAGFDLVLALH